MVIFLLAISNRQWIRYSGRNWAGISAWWSTIPLLILLGDELLRANYEGITAICRQREEAQAEAKTLRKKLHDLGQGKLFEDELGRLLASGQLLLENASTREDEQFAERLQVWLNEVRPHLSHAEWTVVMGNSGLIERTADTRPVPDCPVDDRVRNLLNFRIERVRDYLQRLETLVE